MHTHTEENKTDSKMNITDPTTKQLKEGRTCFV